MINDFFTTTFTISKMTWSGESSEMSTTGTFLGYIQQASPALAEQLGLNFTKTFTIWCPVDTQVKENDSLDDGTASYSVKAINKRDYGENKHLELVVEKDQEYVSV